METDSSLDQKFVRLKQLIEQAKYIVFFSGAGISTSAGIGAFKGENAMGSLLHLREEVLDYKMPTYAHMVVTRLVESGKVKFVVSSNHDNMHRKSGTPDDKLSELFGNAYVEKCLKCSKSYLRKVVCPATNRICDDDACKGRLIKLGVRYGQQTPEEPLSRAWEEARKADLSIVLGSSMGTAPFCSMPPKAKNMVLCNLGVTLYDSTAALTFRMGCDDFMRKVAEMTQINVGEFTYSQKFELGYKKSGNELYTILLKGHNKNEPCTCVESVGFKYKGLDKELDQSNLTKNYEVEIQSKPDVKLDINIVFREEYEAPPMVVELCLDKEEFWNVIQFKKTVDYDK